MKVQSAGRLGNILFIWAYAFTTSAKQSSKRVTVFADRYHTTISKDLLETFELLSSPKVSFTIDDNLGHFLKVFDKLSSITPRLMFAVRRIFRIQIEGLDHLSESAWIQRGYFQQFNFFSDCRTEILHELERIIEVVTKESDLTMKFPFLRDDYQAIHVRLTDFVGSASGVICLESQLNCLEKDVSIVICTDGTEPEISAKIDTSNINVVTAAESTAWETIAILSGARNLVTTNSTLSWWSGFLATSRGSKVWIPSSWKKHKIEPKLLGNGKNLFYPVKFE